MKVVAKNWINYDGKWHGPGDGFQIKNADFSGMEPLVVMDEPTEEQTVPEGETAKVRRKPGPKPKEK